MSGDGGVETAQRWGVPGEDKGDNDGENDEKLEPSSPPVSPSPFEGEGEYSERDCVPLRPSTQEEIADSALPWGRDELRRVM